MRCRSGSTLKMEEHMQIEAAKRSETPREANADSGDDSSQVIALRSELARKIAAHIQVEGDQVIRRKRVAAR